MLKTIIRMIVMVTLMAVAVTMAAFTAAGFRGNGNSAPRPGTYVLADYGGSVAIFENGETVNPLQVTDIELDTLRAADRAMIETGVPVSSREELMELLEDLGS